MTTKRKSEKRIPAKTRPKDLGCVDLGNALDTINALDKKPDGPSVESPTWGHLQRMADVVLAALGGPKGAADKLSWESFYCLSILAALNLDAKKAVAPIFGTKYLT